MYNSGIFSLQYCCYIDIEQLQSTCVRAHKQTSLKTNEIQYRQCIYTTHQQIFSKATLVPFSVLCVYIVVSCSCFSNRSAANMTKKKCILGQLCKNKSASVHCIHSRKLQSWRCWLVAALQVGFHECSSMYQVTLWVWERESVQETLRDQAQRRWMGSPSGNCADLVVTSNKTDSSWHVCSVPDSRQKVLIWNHSLWWFPSQHPYSSCNIREGVKETNHTTLSRSNLATCWPCMNNIFLISKWKCGSSNITFYSKHVQIKKSSFSIAN